MNRAQLDEFLAGLGVKVDADHQGAAKFKDLYVGIGQPHSKLQEVKQALLEAGYGGMVDITRLDHPKAFCLELGSFWDA